MTITQIYQKYKTSKNLQQHMVRVAALASILLKKWKGEQVDKAAIIQTLLFHDIAKPVTFDITKQERFVSSKEDLEKLKTDIQFLISNYGADEHVAALKIFKEIGLSQNAQRLIDNLEWHYADRLLAEHDLESLITIYCDMRIAPKGLLSIRERILELHDRSPIENLEERLSSADALEQVVFSNISGGPNEITNEQVETEAKIFLDEKL